MIIRPYDYRLDALNINKAWREYHAHDFDVPDLSNTITNLVAYNEKHEFVAFGLVKLFAEGVVVLDFARSKRERVNALKPLMTEAFSACKRNSIEQLHVSVTDEKFMKLMMKQYDFKETEGTILVAGV